MSDRLVVYPIPEGIIQKRDFTVSVSLRGTDRWEEVSCYEVKVDMHDVRKASMAYFDFTGKVDIKIHFNKKYVAIYQVDIRPKSRGIIPDFTKDEIFFSLDEPENLSIEINGDRFQNLHLFAGDVTDDPRQGEDDNVVVVKGDVCRPCIHSTDEMNRMLDTCTGKRILYFEPGIHYFSECVYKVPSHTNVYVPGGTVIIGSFVCDKVSDVKIYGRGVVHQAAFERFTSMRGVRISHSDHIWIEGLTFVNPPHYTIYVGGSEEIRIEDIKAFSCEGWSDGIDIMSSRKVCIRRVFMRNSDDCIAIYGHRWDYYGDTGSIRAENCVLWADVAHPINIGCHGNDNNGGDVIESIVFRNIDILEHHEPQKECLGSMCINAGDGNTVRNVCFEEIRVEHMEHGKLLDIQNICGRYNSVPGKLIENIHFINIRYDGCGEETSEISSIDGGEVRNVVFRNLIVRGRKVGVAAQGNIYVGKNVSNVTFM